MANHHFWFFDFWKRGNELKSDRGIDYQPLQHLLATGQWQAADRETAELMLKVANRQLFRILDLEEFCCTDLQTIDRLWQHYSQGKFGISVQQKIYQNLGGTKEFNREIWEAFGDAVGWRVNGNWLYYEELSFNGRAKTGHLPGAPPRTQGWTGCWSWFLLVIFSRLEHCRTSL